MLSPQKAAEALSILNSLLEEIASIKKKQSGMVMDDSELPVNDSYIDSPDFVQLFVKLIKRACEVLTSPEVTSN